MPVPAVVGIAVAAAANTESGKKVMKQFEELPLLAARHASDAALQHGSRLPKIIRKWYRKLSAAQLRGMILVAASAFTFSLLSTLIKYASKTLPSMETVFWRAFVAWLLNLVAVRVSGVSLYVEKPYRLALATRCVVGCCAMSLGFYAMQQMVLADASVLIFTSPVMTFFLVRPIELNCAVLQGYAISQTASILTVCVRIVGIVGAEREDRRGQLRLRALLVRRGHLRGASHVPLRQRPRDGGHRRVDVRDLLRSARRGGAGGGVREHASPAAGELPRGDQLLSAHVVRAVAAVAAAG